MIREITFFPELTEPHGLRASGTIGELGRIVILTGANGAGKTRYLTLIADMLATAPRAAAEHAALAERVRRADETDGELEAMRRRLAYLRRLAEPGTIVVDGPDGLRAPTESDVGIDLTLRPGDRRDPLSEAHETAPAVVERAARALFNAGHAGVAGSPATIAAALDAERLNVLLSALLDKRVEPEVDEVDGSVRARLGQRRFIAGELSAGERVLLTWAVFLHRQAAKLRDAVLFIDEPELHLHPARMARLLERLFQPDVLGERGQVWMATHSPSVLLAAQAGKVLLVEDGAIGWREVTAPEVLDSVAEREGPLLPRTRRGLAVGHSDFGALRRSGARYVDKTMFIVDVLRNGAQVLLFTRPRRFGKTMNQSALRYFLEQSSEDRRELFEDLLVWRDAAARGHFQAYPVVDLTFKDVKARTWPACLESIRRKVANLFDEHRGVLAGALSQQERERFTAVLEKRAEPAELVQALRLLSAILARHRGAPVVILIDEYDTPIISGYLHDGHDEGYYDNAVEFFRNFLSEGLKDNPHLIKGVLTGVLRVAKESLFSGLNNVVSYSLLHPEFADCFGFTTEEVSALLRERGLDRGEEVKAWYDGYRFGERTIYNPWSIANYLNQDEPKPRPFWTETADNELLRRLLIDRGVGLRGELQALLSGGSIHKTIVDDLVLRDIERRPDAVWSLLLFAGYLKATAVDGDRRLVLRIPNLEVARAFEGLVSANMVELLGSTDEVRRLLRAILSGDASTVEELIERFLLNCMSPHSAAVRTPEMYYEAFLLGLLAWLRPDYQVASQQLAGRGRADILITPCRPRLPGAVLELKTLKSRKSVEAELDAAMRQIEDKKYAERLREHGAEPIHEFAVVFDGQRMRVKRR